MSALQIIGQLAFLALLLTGFGLMGFAMLSEYLDYRRRQRRR